MHRSRLSVLAIFAAVAACSKHDESQGTELLSQDRTLVARLEVDQETRKLPLPAACGVVTLAAQPAIANQRQADELTREAQDAEIHGDIQEARSMLRRASELDGTNKSAAYHLGRTSEALGDRSTAMTAYCRYLALTPTTAESVEAHQRVAELSRTVTRTSAGSVADSVPMRRVAAPTTARRVTRERPVAQPRVLASAAVQKSATTSRRSRTSTAAAVQSGTPDSPTQSAPVTTSTEVAQNAESSVAAGDVVATQGSVPPPVEQPAPARRMPNRGPNRAQSSILGAATGAIIGAATGRSVKSAVIGAAAGGILGGVVGPRISPIGRGWGS